MYIDVSWIRHWNQIRLTKIWEHRKIQWLKAWFIRETLKISYFWCIWNLAEAEKGKKNVWKLWKREILKKFQWPVWIGRPINLDSLDLCLQKLISVLKGMYFSYKHEYITPIFEIISKNVY